MIITIFKIMAFQTLGVLTLTCFSQSLSFKQLFSLIASATLSALLGYGIFYVSSVLFQHIFNFILLNHFARVI